MPGPMKNRNQTAPHLSSFNISLRTPIGPRTTALKRTGLENLEHSRSFALPMYFLVFEFNHGLDLSIRVLYTF